MISIANTRLGAALFAALVVVGADVPILAAPANAPATAPTAATVPAGFDFGKATRPIDRFICANAALRWQDLALSRNYRAVRDMLTGPARTALVAQQRDWLGERDRRCAADRTFAELNSPSSPVRDQAYGCLMVVYTDRRRELGDRAAAPIMTQNVIEIDLSPIARARPELGENGRIPFPAMRLSPDGAQVAILLPSQELDFPDQLWLYRVADHKLIPVTPPPDRQDVHPADAVAAVTALAWQGDTIFALASLWGEGGDSEQGQSVVYTATVDGSRRLAEMPDDIKGHFESIFGGLVIREEELPDEETAIQSTQGNADYLVWSADRGHGTVDLHMRRRSPDAAPYLVAWGGWELAQFLFDSPRSRLFYPADTGIALFDIAAKSERRIASTSRGDQPYAVSADHKTFLWSTRNHCGDEYLSEPDSGPDNGASEHFCLATMTGG